VMINADDIPTRIYFKGGGGMTVLPVLKIQAHNGKTYTFDWHSYMGPTFLKKNGDPLACFPTMRHPVWPAFELWMKQGRRVDDENNCIWKDKT